MPRKLTEQEKQELYKKYVAPISEDIKVDEFSDKRYSGAYNSLFNKIYLHYKLDDKAYEDVLAHEAIHALQNYQQRPNQNIFTEILNFLGIAKKPYQDIENQYKIIHKPTIESADIGGYYLVGQELYNEGQQRYGEGNPYGEKGFKVKPSQALIFDKSYYDYYTLPHETEAHVGSSVFGEILNRYNDIASNELLEPPIIAIPNDEYIEKQDDSEIIFKIYDDNDKDQKRVKNIMHNAAVAKYFVSQNIANKLANKREEPGYNILSYYKYKDVRKKHKYPNKLSEKEFNQKAGNWKDWGSPPVVNTIFNNVLPLYPKEVEKYYKPIAGDIASEYADSLKTGIMFLSPEDIKKYKHADEFVNYAKSKMNPERHKVYHRILDSLLSLNPNIQFIEQKPIESKSQDVKMIEENNKTDKNKGGKNANDKNKRK